MDRHTALVLRVVENVIGSLRGIDREFNVAEVVHSITLTTKGPGMFSVEVTSLGEINSQAFEDGVQRILQGESDAGEQPRQPPTGVG